MTPEISAWFGTLLQSRGSVLMEQLSTYSRFTGEARSQSLQAQRSKSVETLFADFYRARGGEEPDGTDAALMREAAELLRNSDAGENGEAIDPALAEKLLAFLLKGGE